MTPLSRAFLEAVHFDVKRLKANYDYTEGFQFAAHDKIQLIGQASALLAIANERCKLLLEIQPLLELAAKVVEAAEVESKQTFGIKNNWCGEWIDCVNCGVPWAVGMNWNDCEPTDACPCCSLSAALAELRAALEKRGG